VEDLRPVAATTAPQGVVARCRPLPESTLEELVAAATPAALLVVDHVEDPHNLGAIVRSAVAAGLPRLVVPTRRAAPLEGAAFKAAAGAFEQVQVASVSSVAAVLARLGELGVWTVGLDASGDRSLFGLELLAEPVAVVVGGEGRGLHRLVRERVDLRVRIPMAGPVESLNASVAAALAAFEVMRVRQAAGSGS
jgi:23S rRNA (guanosine2251-2'-O)-methyltransferase